MGVCASAFNKTLLSAWVYVSRRSFNVKKDWFLKEWTKDDRLMLCCLFFWTPRTLSARLHFHSVSQSVLKSLNFCFSTVITMRSWSRGASLLLKMTGITWFKFNGIQSRTFSTTGLPSLTFKAYRSMCALHYKTAPTSGQTWKLHGVLYLCQIMGMEMFFSQMELNNDVFLDESLSHELGL